MDIALIGQPWDDGQSLDDFLASVADLGQPTSLRVAAAWGRRAGFVRVYPYFEAIRAGGGSVHLILGIDEGGATRQGLETALAICDSVHVFHDLSGRTFHSKVYLAEGSWGARILVGSHNLTPGGVYFNYEAGMTATVGPDEMDSAVVLAQARGLFQRYLADTDACKELTPEVLKRLCEDPSYRVGDEGARRRPGNGGSSPSEDSDSIVDPDHVIPVFGKSVTGKKGSKHSPGSTSARPGSPTPKRAQSVTGNTPVSPLGTDEGYTVARWWKRLKGSDAQQPPSKDSSPTGNLRLAAAGHSIDKDTYFRDDFFGDETWQPDPTKPGLEYAVIDAAVTVRGMHLGQMTFRVDHQPSRIANQNNVPTVLKWGPMNGYLRANNHVDDWVVLEKQSTGGYRILVTGDAPED